MPVQKPIRRWGWAGLFLLCAGAAQAQSYYGNQSVFSSATDYFLDQTSSECSLRFTMPSPSRTLTQIQLSGNLAFTSPVTYIVSVQNDNGSGLPNGIPINAAQDVIFQGSYFSANPAFAMSPVNMTAGNVYHIVVQYGSGSVSPSNFFGPFITLPNTQIIPLGQVPDPNLNFLASQNGGVTWGAQGYNPVFAITFSNGTTFGNPYDSYGLNNVYGTNTVGEVFTAPAGGVYTTHVNIWARQIGTPAGNLTCEIDDLTTPGTLFTGSVANPGSLSTADTWASQPVFPFTLVGGHQYRIWFSAPSCVDSGDCYIFDSSNTTGPASLTFDGTNSYMEASTTGNSGWAANTSDDIGFYFPVAPTPTVTWTPQSTFTPNPTETPPCAPAFGTFGSTVNSEGLVGVGSFGNGSLYTLTEAATVTSLSVTFGVVDPSTQFRMALYSNNAGAIGSVLGQSSGPQQAFNGWNTVSIPATVLNPGSYWILFGETSQGSVGVFDNQPGTTNGEVGTNSFTGGAFPGSFTPTGYSNGTMEFLAGYCPVTPYTPTFTPTPTPTVCFMNLTASGATTTLGPGTYNFCGVTIGGGASPSVCYITGPATINVSGNFVMNTNGFIEMQNTNNSVSVFVNGGSFIMNSSSEVNASNVGASGGPAGASGQGSGKGTGSTTGGGGGGGHYGSGGTGASGGLGGTSYDTSFPPTLYGSGGGGAPRTRAPEGREASAGVISRLASPAGVLPA